MNIERAKSISLVKILNKLGLKPLQLLNNEYWFLSPFRRERKAKFKIDHLTNHWYDQELEKGGDNVDFACAYLDSQGASCSEADALRWISYIAGYAHKIEPIELTENIQKQPKLDVEAKQKVIDNLHLLDYFDRSVFPLSVTSRYLIQVRLRNKETGKTFSSLALRNESGGHYLRTPYFTGNTGKKDISFIRGSTIKPDSVHIFKDILDYLSAVIHQNNGQPFKDDAIILNCFSILTKATPYIKGYGYRTIYTWMPNDQDGKNATKSMDAFFKTEDQLIHKPMNKVYAPYKDVNAWHTVRLGLNE